MNPALIFGQVSPPVEIAGWLACAAFIIILVNNAFKLTDRLKEKPPPHETYQVKGNYATREEVHLLRHDLNSELRELKISQENIRHEMRHDKDALLAAAEDRAEKLHGRINDVLEAVSELRGRTLR